MSHEKVKYRHSCNENKDGSRNNQRMKGKKEKRRVDSITRAVAFFRVSVCASDTQSTDAMKMSYRVPVTQSVHIGGLQRDFTYENVSHSRVFVCGCISSSLTERHVK